MSYDKFYYVPCSECEVMIDEACDKIIWHDDKPYCAYCADELNIAEGRDA